jgi:steroid delta-isomerase-like uncharacterized protein
MAPADVKAVVQALVRAYNARSVEEVAGLYGDDAVYWDPLHPEGVRGRAAIRELLVSLFDAYPDERLEIEALVADDRQAVAELLSTGTAPGGRPFRLALTEVYAVQDGRIVSCRAYFDPVQLTDC